MLTYAEALNAVLRATPLPRQVEDVPLAEAAGRVLARSVRSDVDVPPFDKAAMDGFAVRASDLVELPARLPLAGAVAAGQQPPAGLPESSAVQVMTGAPVPAGADAVVQVEWTTGFDQDPVVVERGPVRVGLNLSPRGEIVAKGSTVLEHGALLRPEEVSLLAAAGCDPVPVWARPTVAVLSTGDEVVPASATPGPAQIRDANRAALLALVTQTGGVPVDLGIAPDEPGALRAAIDRGLQADVLVLSGGASDGQRDLVKATLAAAGVELAFTRLAVKPGRPTLAGRAGGTLVLGLPGNPASALVIARVFLVPALRRRSGRTHPSLRRLRAPLGLSVTKKADRLWLVPAVLGSDGVVMPLRPRGSADLPTAIRADGYVVAPRGETRLEAGATVEVLLWEA